jgi:rRNA small subunit pseudouridine methyltransferase Nep1
MLTLILAEAALETIPPTLWNHSSVRNHSKKQRKPMQQLLLDRSQHHYAMRKLENSQKRGRPDITHIVLLQALGSPLNKEGLLKIYVHTYNNFVITVSPITRIPRNYNQFTGLIEQLFKQGKVPSVGETLLMLEQKTLKKLLEDVKADYVLAFSREGTPKTLEEAIYSLKIKRNIAVIIGGFPYGHFSKTTLSEVCEPVCVDSEMLEAGVLTSRIIYDYERAFYLPQKRIRKKLIKNPSDKS